jgi:imidazoleglycerol phosphate synthase glutamine amidotransferase subunit HisH
MFHRRSERKIPNNTSDTRFHQIFTFGVAVQWQQRVASWPQRKVPHIGRNAMFHTLTKCKIPYIGRDTKFYFIVPHTFERTASRQRLGSMFVMLASIMLQTHCQGSIQFDDFQACVVFDTTTGIQGSRVVMCMRGSALSSCRKAP